MKKLILFLSLLTINKIFSVKPEVTQKISVSDLPEELQIKLQKSYNEIYHDSISNSISILITTGISVGLHELKKMDKKGLLKNSPSCQWIINHPIKYSIIAGLFLGIVLHGIHFLVKVHYKNKKKLDSY